MAYTNSERTQARKKVDELLSQRPQAYVSAYRGLIDSTLKKINEREPFSYNMNADALYKQYLSASKEAGKMAMMDAEADTAANTGGFDNSYSVTAGMDAYTDILNGAYGAADDYEKRALKRYEDEGEALYKKLAAYQQAEDSAYKKYAADVDRYYDELDYWSKIAKSSSGGKKSSANKQVKSQIYPLPPPVYHFYM